jgi:hypothetical protein
MDGIDVKHQPDEPQPPGPRGCAANGCPCKDVRIVSRRRARFYAYLAQSRGQKATRTIPSDPSWRLPVSAHAAIQSL